MGETLVFENTGLLLPDLVVLLVVGVPHGTGGQEVPFVTAPALYLLVDILPHGEQDVAALVGLDPPDHAHQVTGQVTDIVQAQVPAEFRHIVRTPALIGTRSVENDHDVARNLSPHGGEGPTQTPLLIVTLEKHHAVSYTHLRAHETKAKLV